MELDKIKELVAMMEANDLTEIEIVDGPTRVMLKRGSEQAVPHMMTMPQIAAAGPPQSQPAGPAAAAPDDTLAKIITPMVGTFYSAPSPNADPFVKIGDSVDEDTVIGIIEAMKVMNEIKSEVKGTIKKTLVANGESVEYDQTLFLVEPD
ncbi:MAG: acetyl-CoA carboxylase biotin carboxyl carrier protein [Phycisphaerae bacterium]|nr:acetyl-CoA carboxylase biotin carboxyl carrier protein [Phycisphaerae bacterium]